MTRPQSSISLINLFRSRQSPQPETWRGKLRLYNNIAFSILSKSQHSYPRIKIQKDVSIYNIQALLSSFSTINLTSTSTTVLAPSIGSSNIRIAAYSSLRPRNHYFDPPILSLSIQRCKVDSYTVKIASNRHNSSSSSHRRDSTNNDEQSLQEILSNNNDISNNDNNKNSSLKVIDPVDEYMINELISYKQIHGDCHVPAGMTQNSIQERKRLGISEDLTKWVRKQRLRYKNIQNGRIKHKTDADRIRIFLLESIGFIWFEREAQWQRSFNRLDAHQQQHGTLDVDAKEHPHLWSWTDQQRKAYSAGKLSEERTTLLKDLGFVFDLQEASWWQFYEQLCEYGDAHGTVDIPTQNKDYPSLGTWVARQRRHFHAGELAKDRIEALEKIGFSFDVYADRWMQSYRRLAEFYETHGHTHVPVSDPLWQWVDRQRKKLRRRAFEGSDKINTSSGEFVGEEYDHTDDDDDDDDDDLSSSESSEKITALNKINFNWSVADDKERAKRLMDLTFSVDIQDERWIRNYKNLCSFKERFGHFSIPPKHPDYQELASWAKHQRYLHKRNRLSAERISALDEIDFIWTGQGARWVKLYQQLVQFQAKHGHTRVPTKYRELYRWTNQQRKALRKKQKLGESSSSSSILSMSPSFEAHEEDVKRHLLELEKLLVDD